MTFSNFSRIPNLAVTAALLTAATCHAQLASPVLSKLEAFQTKPESAGALVYPGAAFAQRQPAANPLFRYERRVIILESATLSNAYEMRRFEVTNRQYGFAGSVQVSNYR
jgi:hypothetical protein